VYDSVEDGRALLVAPLVEIGSKMRLVTSMGAQVDGDGRYSLDVSFAVKAIGICRLRDGAWSLEATAPVGEAVTVRSPRSAPLEKAARDQLEGRMPLSVELIMRDFEGRVVLMAESRKIVSTLGGEVAIASVPECASEIVLRGGGHVWRGRVIDGVMRLAK